MSLVTDRKLNYFFQKASEAFEDIIPNNLSDLKNDVGMNVGFPITCDAINTNYKITNTASWTSDEIPTDTTVPYYFDLFDFASPVNSNDIWNVCVNVIFKYKIKRGASTGLTTLTANAIISLTGCGNIPTFYQVITNNTKLFELGLWDINKDIGGIILKLNLSQIWYGLDLEVRELSIQGTDAYYNDNDTFKQFNFLTKDAFGYDSGDEFINVADKLSFIKIDKYHTISSVALDDALANVDVDLSDYYTKSEVDTAIGSKDLSDYYTKTEVDNAIAAKDLSGYYTKTEIDNKGYLTEHQSLDSYYTKTDVDNKITPLTTMATEINNVLEEILNNWVPAESSLNEE